MQLETVVIVAIVAALPGLLAGLAAWRKSSAEASKAISDAATQMIKPLSERVQALEGEVTTLRTLVASFRRGVELLCGQVRGAGMEPVWQPDKDDHAK